MTSKTRATRSTTKINYTPLQLTTMLQRILSRVERQPTEWKKLFAKPVSDKVLYLEYRWNTCKSIRKRQLKNG